MDETKLLQRTIKAGQRVIEELRVNPRINNKEFTLYNAGIKDGETRFGLFARDLFLSAFILDDSDFLRQVVKFACLTQGKTQDPQTGEEPGKIIHEHDHVNLRGRETRYNASDTTQLALIGLGKLLDEGYHAFIKNRESSIQKSLNYLFNHIREGLFWEDPSYCGANRYALKSTYWKDDRLPSREHPHYPIAYMLVQAQTIAALRESVKLAGVVELSFSQGELKKTAKEMADALLSVFWDDQIEFFAIAKDELGLISGISSDGLHALAYLEPEDIPKKKLEKIMEKSKTLLTPYGFRTYRPDQPDYSPDSYHLGSVWPFEQYFIAKSGNKFNQPWLVTGGSRVLNALDKHGFYELFGWKNGKLYPLGCDKQLWSACLPVGLDGIVGR
ncbi:hypothetical protein K9M78_02880 [Candidatus Bipolaricaulota bacterium]|nr:hypothetical protein [Candidatus Bipolaricaulota bacterium]